MSLFLKLQKRVTELEQEKQVMQDELDRKEEQVLRSKAKVRNAVHPRAAGKPSTEAGTLYPVLQFLLNGSPAQKYFNQVGFGSSSEG